MSQFFQKLYEGGPYFMYPLLFVLLLILILTVQAFIKKETRDKNESLISSFGLFALIFGLLGQLLGLIQAFDFIQKAGDISMTILMGGLKVSMLSTTFGAIIFLISRISLITLTCTKK